MQNKPVNLLFRDDLKPEDFNDDTIWRALDRLFENDPTMIFMQISLKTANVLGISRKFLHLDSTTISVQGEYNFEDTDQIPIRITKGHTKNKRYEYAYISRGVLTLFSLKCGVGMVHVSAGYREVCIY